MASNQTFNDLLYFLVNQYDTLPRQSLNATILKSYSKEHFLTAKQILVSQCEKNKLTNQITDFKRNRISPNIEQKLVKDIIDIWDVIDRETGGDLDTVFAASLPASIPANQASLSVGDISLPDLFSSVLKLQQQNEYLRSQLEVITKSLTAIHHKLPRLDDTFLLNQSTRSSHLQSPTSGRLSSPLRSLPKTPFVTPSPLSETLSTTTESTVFSSVHFGPLATTAATIVTDVTPAATEVTTPVASKVTPAATVVTPVATEVTPAATEATPAATEATTPATTEATDATDATPAAKEATPAATEARPAATNVTPAATNVTPGATVETPAATDDNPAATNETPAATDVTPAASDETSAVTDDTPVAADASGAAPAATGEASDIAGVPDNSSTANRRSYSSTASDLSSSRANWTLAKARNKKRIIPVIGRAERIGDDDLEGVAPNVKNYAELSISRLSVSTTSDKVKSHLHKHGIEVRDVFILSSKINGTKSAKVRVAIEQRDRAKSPDIWPQHCRVADWVNFKKKSRPANGPDVDNGGL